MSTASRGWSPILAGPLRQRALDSVGLALIDVRQSISARTKRSSRDFSLAGGDAGHALLFAHCAHVDFDSQSADDAMHLFGIMCDAIEGPSDHLGLLSGWVGYAWTVNHLWRLLYPKEIDPLTEVDAMLLDIILHHHDWRFKLDLFDGLLGFGVYALARPHSEAAQACVAAVIKRLAECAERDDVGLFWTRPAETLLLSSDLKPTEPYVDLGMARGLPSVVAFLGKAASEPIASVQAKDLLLSSVRWLLARGRDRADESCYSIASARGRDYGAAQTAWCYGDPGIAAALMLAHAGAPEYRWDVEVRRLGDRICARPLSDPSIFDAGFCHGATGVAHILNRLHCFARSEDYAIASIAWFEHALRMQKRQYGSSGFTFRWEGSWMPITGLLRGVTGVALTFLAGATSSEPTWDQVFLIS